MSSQITLGPFPRPGADEGVGKAKTNEQEKSAAPCPNLAARLPRPWPNTERGGWQDERDAGITSSPAQSGEKHPKP